MLCFYSWLSECSKLDDEFEFVEKLRDKPGRKGTGFSRLIVGGCTLKRDSVVRVTFQEKARAKDTEIWVSIVDFEIDEKLPVDIVRIIKLFVYIYFYIHEIYIFSK